MIRNLNSDNDKHDDIDKFLKKPMKTAIAVTSIHAIYLIDKVQLDFQQI